MLNSKSVNFSRRDSVQLLADAQWSYYGTRMKEKRRLTTPWQVIWENLQKNQFSINFYGFSLTTLQGEVVPHFLLRPCGIIWPLRIRQQLNGLSTTKIDWFKISKIQKIKFFEKLSLGHRSIFLRSVKTVWLQHKYS